MEQKWTEVLLLLVFCHKMTSTYTLQVKDGEQVEISCQPSDAGSSTIIWFRMLDSGRSEFIASFSNGMKKETDSKPSSIFSYGKIKKHILILESFRREQDSGLYTCGVLVKGKELRFGQVTQLFGETVQSKPTVAPVAMSPQPVTIPSPCACSSPGATKLSLSCPLHILGPLAGGCGLLLLLLVVTALYCNRVRTRRCPHHYKRKLRGMPAGNK